MTDEFHPGDWITGPFWEGPVQVVAYVPRVGYDQAMVSLAAGATRTYVLTPADVAQLTRVTPAGRRTLTFSGDPARFHLAIQAHRLRLAHALDPYAALNASRIDPLPHQFEAVYEHLLARPVVRALLAHDAGAGKTVMAGMVIKELQRRQGVQRVLIVAPAGLTRQWRRELLTKFALDFTIVERDFIQEHHLDDLLVWQETTCAITSVDFARQKRLRQALESVLWDLVIVDEAHKLAAYRRPNGAIEKRQAYELGETLTRHTTHFLLMTATPHKGDPENYRLLIRLIDPQWGDAAAYTGRGNSLVLRRTKEEMRKADGGPLYPERLVEPQYYNISPTEGALLEAVQAYAKKHYAGAATKARSSRSRAWNAAWRPAPTRCGNRWNPTRSAGRCAGRRWSAPTAARRRSAPASRSRARPGRWANTCSWSSSTAPGRPGATSARRPRPTVLPSAGPRRSWRNWKPRALTCGASSGCFPPCRMSQCRR